MMDQGNPAEESHPVEASLATAEEPNMGQGNLPGDAGLPSTAEEPNMGQGNLPGDAEDLPSTMEGLHDMVQKYKEKLREVYRAEDLLRTARPVVGPIGVSRR